MLADRIEAKWIDAFCEIFERCAVTAGDVAAILSETQSRALTCIWPSLRSCGWERSHFILWCRRRATST